MDEKTALAYAITRAIAFEENGGTLPKKPKAGKSGELASYFQFTPDTWKKDAAAILGNPNAPLTPDNETHVVTTKVGKWIDAGYNVKQIASMWNAGEGEPNAYGGKFSNGQPSHGKNKFGVQFNVPNYANGVQKYAQQFYKGKFHPKKITAASPQASAQPSSYPNFAATETSETPI